MRGVAIRWRDGLAAIAILSGVSGVQAKTVYTGDIIQGVQVVSQLDVNEHAGSVRRWIDAQTFAPRTGAEGIRLLRRSSCPTPAGELGEFHLIDIELMFE